MSYCRFSSEDFSSDLYCYQAAEGYVTSIASNRVVGDIPKVKPRGDDVGAWVESHNLQSAFIQSAERAPIGLPHAGETFVDPDLESFLARLLELRGIGYVFPDYVLDTVRGEMAGEGDNIGTSAP